MNICFNHPPTFARNHTWAHAHMSLRSFELPRLDRNTFIFSIGVWCRKWGRNGNRRKIAHLSTFSPAQTHTYRWYALWRAVCSTPMQRCSDPTWALPIYHQYHVIIHQRHRCDGVIYWKFDPIKEIQSKNKKE